MERRRAARIGERGGDSHSYPESLSGRAAAAAVAPDLNDNPERRRATYSADGWSDADGRTTEARFEWGLRTHARALCSHRRRRRLTPIRSCKNARKAQQTRSWTWLHGKRREEAGEREEEENEDDAAAAATINSLLC